MTTALPENVLRSLRALDTCTAANAIEHFNTQLRNEGFCTSNNLHCHFPEMASMFGYAMTLRVRTANPPMEGGAYADRTDWWQALEALPKPHVVVIQDMDKTPGIGAFIGDVHAAILQAMGCVGVITNGAVRDLPAVQSRGFHLFSKSVSPSHAYVHVIDVGAPVEIAGLRIDAGDLLLGDRHGIVRIPPSLAAEIPQVAARSRASDREITDFCKSENFSREGLEALLKSRRS
jgi:4-hydroxy-4-methyl-2-oxoglutarate aldolase